MRSPRPSENGFTLLELVIAFTILALMAGMVFASLRMAVNVYDRSQTRIEEQATRRVLFDQVKRQVGSLFPLRPSAGFVLTEDPYREGADPIAQLAASQVPLFYGEPDFVVFITVAPLILHESPGLTIVRYGLAQDEYGDFYLGLMEAPFTGEDSFRAMVSLPRGRPLPVVEDIDLLEFQYYGWDSQTRVYNWYQSWSGAEMASVPQAIRINFDSEYIFISVNANAFGVAGPVSGLLGARN
jgi:prepilin-type N-terminal cleavage/methylation domain-containing protein